MRTLTMALTSGILATGVLAGCAALSGNVDDQGRAYRETNEAEVDANLEPLSAEASIQLFNEPVPQLGGRARVAGGTPASACDAERWQSLLGVRQGNIQRDGLPETYRVIPFGAMVTQDYLPNRLNVYLDQNDVVYRVTCG